MCFILKILITLTIILNHAFNIIYSKWYRTTHHYFSNRENAGDLTIYVIMIVCTIGLVLCFYANIIFLNIWVDSVKTNMLNISYWLYLSWAIHFYLSYFIKVPIGINIVILFHNKAWLLTFMNIWYPYV